MVTLATLDRLVGLADRNIQGAAEQLAAYRHQQPEAMANVLGISVDELALEPADLVDQIRMKRRSRRSDRARRREARTAALARRLEDTAVAEGDSFVLDPGNLVDLASTGAPGTLVFTGEERTGAIDLRFLRRLARACKGAVIVRVELSGGRLMIRYATEASRGGYRLRLQPETSSDPIFEVRLGTVPDPPAVAAAPPPSLWDHIIDAVGRAA